jgi:nucleotide-binding universal stress UspA family protein
MKILVATDGSADALDAMEWLEHVPVPDDASVDVVSVMPYPTPTDAAVALAWSEVRAESERVVDDGVRRLSKRRPTVTGRVLGGAEPREAIMDAARQASADLIVMGARGLGAVASMLLGSVSLGVTRHAPCPVLVCKGAPRPVRTVTVALDGSEDSRAALDFFAALPLSADLAVRLVGVVEPFRYPTTAPGIIGGALRAAVQDIENERRQTLETALAPAVNALRPRLRKLIVTLPTGQPAATILREAEAHGSDLIVVGARGLGALERIALGSVSEAVLRHATVPVLVVRPRAAA